MATAQTSSPSQDPGPDSGEAPELTGWRGLTPKDVRGFLLRLVLWYALFLVPFTGIDKLYGGFFRFSGNLFYGSFLGDVSLDFRAKDGPNHMDTIVIIKEKGRPPADKATNSRLMGYLPTAFLVALVLATRSSWPLKRKRLLWGFGLISIVVGIRVGIDLYATLAPSEYFSTISIRPSWVPALKFVHEVAAFQPSTGFIAAGLVWFVLTLATDPSLAKGTR